MKALLVSLIFVITPISLVNADFTAGSLYEIPFNWSDESGGNFKLASLSGSPVILTMAYSRCKTACPFTMQRIKRVATALKERSINANYIIVSLDPKNDTPETLSKFKKTYELEGNNWHLLTGSEGDLRKLSVLVGYSYQQNTDNTEIAHSNKILALDKTGTIVTEIEGLGSDLEPFIKAVGKLR